MGRLDDMAEPTIGIQTILVIIFTLMKVHGCIDWSWWWVFSPWWIPAVGLFTIVFVAVCILLLIDNK
tara:strand:+ start:348 stop:548 length:201 start_codon:yes stop_codon:yes gene_type:complete